MRFTWSGGAWQGRTADEVLSDSPGLADCLQVVASENGFPSWESMVAYSALCESEPDGPAVCFEQAVQAVVDGDAAGLRSLLDRHPGLAARKSQRPHGACLLHYLAANGVENDVQRTPGNAVEICRMLFAAGAGEVANATAGFYGGGGGSTPLVGLVTSTHPAEAGVQPELVKLYVAGGALADGIDGDGLPLASALAFRCPAAARALEQAGARIDNAAVAAALGRTDLLRAMLDRDAPAGVSSGAFPNPVSHLGKPYLRDQQEVLQQAMVWAGMCGEIDCVDLLLEGGISINAAPVMGQTALHEACYQGRSDAAEALLARGADPALRDLQWNATPSGWAAAGGHSELAARLGAAQ